MTSPVDHNQKWTYQDYQKLPDYPRFEIIRNVLLEEPSPTPYHQDVSMNLGRKFQDFVEEKKSGKIYHAPLDIVFDENNVVQPDLIFISNHQKSIIGPKNIQGSPELVVEILSPASIKKDRFWKLEIYQKFGVKEFWIADPANKSIEVYKLKNGKFKLFSLAAETGKVKSKVLNGFEVDVDGVFD